MAGQDPDPAEGIVFTFLSALQASISVLLVIFYGVLACQINLIDEPSARNVSRLCVKMFLPALLLTNIGSQLNIESGPRYVPIIIWAVAYNIIAGTILIFLRKICKLPSWVTPACVFNNTTAFPLLLIQSLSKTSVFKALLWFDGDNTEKALERAVSYFLINSMVSNSFTFGLGPMLLDRDPHEEDDTIKDTAADEVYRVRSDPLATREDIERAMQREREVEEEEIETNEQTSLLPHRANVARVKARHESYKFGRRIWEIFPHWVQVPLERAYRFISPVLVGAVIGIIIGVVPPLQKIFFHDVDEGGYFNAWLTVSIRNIGELFATLQVVVVGIKLSKSLRNMKHGDESGSIPWMATIFVLLFRFVMMPAISVGIMYGFACNTNIIPRDPVLFFTMMIMHTGPPALELVAMADVAGSNEKEKMSIAKLTTVCYSVSPVMAFTVVAALAALEACL